jgi:DNA-binding NtrC family response regulator
MKQQANILIVDDELEIRELLDEFLRLKGYAVFTVASGAEILACLKANKPDLVLVDMSLPGMNGLDILRSIRATDPSIGVIMMTGLYDADVARQAIESGAYGYLPKPLDLRRLEDAIRAALTGGPHAGSARSI